MTAPVKANIWFLEANKWLIGLSMDAHLFTSVDEHLLEQTTTGPCHSPPPD